MKHSQIAAEGRLEKLREAAEGIVSEYPCRIISQPLPGMVMVKNIDPIENTAFFLGEAFITQCEAEVGEKLGYCCVLGDEPERSVYGAILDAACGNELPLPEAVLHLLEEEERHIGNKWSEEDRRIAGTKVQFDVRKG